MAGTLVRMTDTPARLLNLLSLLQTPREWPGSELAERLDVSARTIRRDIDRLRDLGYPVEATKGAVGGYRLVAGAAMPPLLLDDEEAVAIAVGLRAARGMPSRASRRRPYGRWRSWSRCCPPGFGTGSPRSRRRRCRCSSGGTPRVWTADADGHRVRDHRYGAAAVRLPREGRRGDQAAGRAVPPGVDGPALVSRRVRPGAGGLAYVPRGPGRRSVRDGCPLHAA